MVSNMIFLLQLYCIFHVFGVKALEKMSDNIKELQINNDIKPGHQIVKEFHFHPYWHQNNHQEVNVIFLS